MPSTPASSYHSYISSNRKSMSPTLSQATKQASASSWKWLSLATSLSLWRWLNAYFREAPMISISLSRTMECRRLVSSGNPIVSLSASPV